MRTCHYKVPLFTYLLLGVQRADESEAGFECALVLRALLLLLLQLRLLLHGCRILGGGVLGET